MDVVVISLPRLLNGRRLGDIITLKGPRARTIKYAPDYNPLNLRGSLITSTTPNTGGREMHKENTNARK